MLASVNEQMPGDARALLFAGVDVPRATRAKVDVNRGIAGAVTHVYRRDAAQKVQVAPQAAVEVAARILQVSLEISVSIVRRLQQPGVEVEPRPRVLAACLDGKVAVQRVSELVRHAHAHPRHEQEGAVGDGVAAVQRSRIFEGADGEVVTESALHAVEIHHRGHGISEFRLGRVRN